MKLFHCEKCEHLVFFENSDCVKCGSKLAFIPSRQTMASLIDDGAPHWRSVDAASNLRVRLCANYSDRNICNWAIDPEDTNTFCVSCRLTRVTPDLSRDGAVAAWFKLEIAKRRLVYRLNSLGLPVRNKTDDPGHGLAFEFLADPLDPAQPRVLTGHADGVITVNIAEANDPERERRRLEMGEPYRTVLGHLRHEVGHYFWDRLIRDSPRLTAFREKFGDETQDYQQALQRHHAQGAPSNWQANFISAYATMHPWEDFAETWAHYLHMTDLLETGRSCGVSIRPQRENEPSLRRKSPEATNVFDELIDDWFAMTYLLNNLNRSLGHGDAYPFVLSTPAIEKLRFVHETIVGDATKSVPATNK
jgi:hypothetical protein